MTVSSAQYHKFVEQAIRHGEVFTFTEGGEYLIYKVHDHEVIPFWSSRARVDTAQQRHEKYRKYEISQLALDRFLRWLPNMAEEHICIGVNWSGKNLTGYDLPANDVLARFERELHAEA